MQLSASSPVMIFVLHSFLPVSSMPSLGMFACMFLGTLLHSIRSLMRLARTWYQMPLVSHVSFSVFYAFRLSVYVYVVCCLSSLWLFLNLLIILHTCQSVWLAVLFLFLFFASPRKSSLLSCPQNHDSGLGCKTLEFSQFLVSQYVRLGNTVFLCIVHTSVFLEWVYLLFFISVGTHWLTFLISS